MAKRYAALVMSCALLAACEAAKPAAPGRGERVAVVRSPRQNVPPPAPRSDDTCPDRLHALAGLFLQYAALHRDLPASLENLRPLLDADATPPFSCPATGREYIYTPGGLAAPGDARRLIVHDALPSHNGKRGAIMMTPAKDRQPLGFFAIEIDDAVLGAFR